VLDLNQAETLLSGWTCPARFGRTYVGTTAARNEVPLIYRGHIGRCMPPAGRKMLISDSGCNRSIATSAKRVGRSRCRGSPRHRLRRLAMPNTLRRGRPFRRGGILVASDRPDATCANVGETVANQA
jgi:hypothetical protein